jgi:cysteine desulfurase/selenocysteine lyase
VAETVKNISKSGVEQWRQDFPILEKQVYGRALAYLDSASSAQKPLAVIGAMNDAMCDHYANIHRGLYYFSQTTTTSFEAVRPKLAAFIGAVDHNEIVLTRNATEGINLVAQCWGRAHLNPGDEIILSQMEHHANIVPWQLLAEEKGLKVKFISLTPTGELDLEAFKSLLSDKTKLVSVTQVSNVLGTRNDVKQIVNIAKEHNAEIKVMIDGAQGAVHGSVNVLDIGCDFYVMTGHKLYGPTGIGVLWGKYEVLEAMPPYQGGGDMIEAVTFDGSTFKAPPARFEAGTPAFVEAIGLGQAIEYLDSIGLEAITSHESGITDYTYNALSEIDGLTLYGPDTSKREGVFSFSVDWGHPSDVAMILDQSGVAVRSGHHCCMPLMQVLGVDATVRASIGLYTTQNDIDLLLSGLIKAKDMLA